MKKVVYSAIFGGYDSLKEPSYVDKDVKYILFTDNLRLKSKVWDIRYTKVIDDNPRKTARKIKLRPDLYLPPDTEKSIWIDGSIKQTGSFQSMFNENADFVAVKHPQRQCVYEEGKACRKLGKDTASNINKQMRFYKDQNFPKDAGMIDSSFLVRTHSDKMFKFGKDWYDQIERFTIRDQLGFPWAFSNNPDLVTKYITVKQRSMYTQQYGH